MDLSGKLIEGTGTFSVQELSAQDSVLKHLDIGTKYLLCENAGTVAMVQTFAYPTVEFDFYHKDTSTTGINFICNAVDDITLNTYMIWILNNERLALRINSSYLLYSAESYVAADTWYRIKITRDLSGSFTVYIKGGAFGDTWTLVSVVGGTGSNPVQDSSYSTSQYAVFDLGVGDKIANIEITNQVRQ